MKHYIRDLNMISYSVDRDAGQSAASFAIFHFLRNAGWTWLWECDGQLDTPGHCPDGNMEDSGVTNWTVSGGTRAKDTTTVHMGTQSLKWDTTAASQTLTSANFTNMTNSRSYQQVIWFYNNSGQTFTLNVYDGSSLQTPVNLPSTGGWASYRVAFTKNAAGNAYFVITAPGVAGSYTAYLDSCMTFESFFEYNTSGLLADYSDGQILASNQFNSASYAFSASDIGKHVVIWDTSNLGNSGVYQITSEAAGVVTLDIRVSGAETLTTNTGLKWRLIDLSQAPKTEATSANESACGWGLESPHSQKMRLYMRHREDGGDFLFKYLVFWCSAIDQDFNVLNGIPYDGSPHSNYFCADYQWADGQYPETFHWFYLYSDAAKSGGRLYLMTDDDGSFVTAYFRTGETEKGFFLTGYTGATTDFTTLETWCCLGARYSDGQEHDFAQPEVNTWAAFSRGMTVYGNRPATVIGAIYGCYNATTEPISMTNAKANPFGGEEWLQPLMLVRNISNAGTPWAERECDVGVYWARQNITDFTTFDSNNYFKFPGGMTWDWPGVSVIA